MNLEGKIALVTGGNRGIGRAISIELAKKGAVVVINYVRDSNSAEETEKHIKRSGGKSLVIQADITKLSGVRDMVNEIKEKFSRLDILVNNAGTAGPNSKIELIEEDEWNSVIAVNMTGVFNCCKAAVEELIKNRGKIVNISSISGKMGGTIGSHYAASKAGVIGFTFALASELAPNVMVNAVAPGPVDTDFISPEVKERLSKQTPFGRIATPEEIAHTVIYLLENDYVSGEVIDVNAGRYMD